MLQNTPIKTPNLYIVGVAKAGTTSLHNILSNHPEIQMSAVKEPHFFLDERKLNVNTTPSVREFSAYLNLFDAAAPHTNLKGEASPSYFWDLTALERIHAANSGAFIIVMLRDPFKRAYSHYQMEIHAEREHATDFLQAITNDAQNKDERWGSKNLYIALSHYYEGLKTVKKLFKSDRILILYYETFFQNLESSLEMLANFLEISNFEGIDARPRNQGSYSSQLMKYLKKLPGRQFLSDRIKRPLKRLINQSAKGISQKEVEALLPYFKNDLIKTHNELGIDFYTHLLLTSYSINLFEDV
jgi:hypothetical protein